MTWMTTAIAYNRNPRGPRVSPARLGLAIVLSLAWTEDGRADIRRCELPPLPLCRDCVAKLALTLRDGSCRAEWIAKAAVEAAFAEGPVTVEISIAGTRLAPSSAGRSFFK